MKNPNYGLIKGKINSYETQNLSTSEVENKKKQTAHYNFSLNCNGNIYNANINVLSRNMQSPDLKVFFSDTPNVDLKNLGALDAAKSVVNGVYKNVEENLSIDYLRGDYFDLTKLQIITDVRELEEMFLYYLIDHHIRTAKEQNYDICVWGALYEDGISGNTKNGIHDIHMNQGNANKIDNAIWSDGLFAIYDGNQLKFVCFLAFSGQSMKTDDDGNPIT
ncbi:MAG: DUF2278 family protein [Malacoplasma sp.]